jgi:hypothetical protein
MMPGARELKATGTLGSASAFASGPTSPLSLPMWGDGAKWDQPEYYETIRAGRRRFPKTVQSSDVDGDGQDELIARSRGGILCERFDPDTGQWMHMSSINRPPAWADEGTNEDSTSWNKPEYYSTIQSADIDGDGQAEILGRAVDGLKAWRYDKFQDQWIALPVLPYFTDEKTWIHPKYYSTIQCADIDGDGQAEVLGRGADGIEVYKYDKVQNQWKQLALLAHFTDKLTWDRPEYYSTIQCADIDNDKQAEILGRGAFGIEVYKYDKVQDQWKPMTDHAPAWSDTDPITPWTKPEHYSTIQCADINGDGQAEILGRTVDGMEVWRYDKLQNNWALVDTAHRIDFSNNLGWNVEECYSTIQCADIDGDGHDEVLARAIGGVIAYKYMNGDWSMLPLGTLWPSWDNRHHWNKAQYYKTIQTARVKVSKTNPNNPEVPSGHPTVAALIGRSASAIETWRHDGGEQWMPTSAPLPDFTGDEVTMYNYLTNLLYPTNPQGGIRTHYYLEDSEVLKDKAASLYIVAPASYYESPLPDPYHPAPPGVSETTWKTVTWQIYWELRFASHVNDWYANKVKSFITDLNLGYGETLKTVAQYIDLPTTDSTSLSLNILSLIFNGIWSLTAFGDSGLVKIISAVSGLLSTAFTAGSDYEPGTGSIQLTYAELQRKLDEHFVAAIKNNGLNQKAINGGMVDGVYKSADWGLLSAIGQQIDAGLWSWPDGLESDLLPAMLHAYATNVWQIMMPQKWYWTSSPHDISLPEGYPDAYFYIENWSDASTWHWLGVGSRLGWDYPAVESLDQLFKPNADGLVFPLGAQVNDVYFGRKGWPNVRVEATELGSPKPKSLGVDLRVWDMTLTRVPETGEVVATFILANHGLTGASNLWITGAQLRNSQAIDGAPSRHIHLDHGQEREMRVRFPANVGVAGSTVVLRLSGKYLNGTFGGSYRVKLP